MPPNLSALMVITCKLLVCTVFSQPTLPILLMFCLLLMFYLGLGFLLAFPAQVPSGSPCFVVLRPLLCMSAMNDEDAEGAKLETEQKQEEKPSKKAVAMEGAGGDDGESDEDEGNVDDENGVGGSVAAQSEIAQVTPKVDGGSDAAQAENVQVALEAGAASVSQASSAAGDVTSKGLKKEEAAHQVSSKGLQKEEAVATKLAKAKAMSLLPDTSYVASWGVEDDDIYGQKLLCLHCQSCFQCLCPALPSSCALGQGGCSEFFILKRKTK